MKYDFNMPCAHTIPGTCDFCPDESAHDHECADEADEREHYPLDMLTWVG